MKDKIESSSQVATEGAAQQSSTIGVAQRFNIIIDGLKPSNDTEIADLIIKWMDYKFADYLEAATTESHCEEPSEEVESMELDEYLLGRDPFLLF